jgi:hypothetical protein
VALGILPALGPTDGAGGAAEVQPEIATAIRRTPSAFVDRPRPVTGVPFGEPSSRPHRQATGANAAGMAPFNVSFSVTILII